MSNHHSTIMSSRMLLLPNNPQQNNNNNLNPPPIKYLWATTRKMEPRKLHISSSKESSPSQLSSSWNENNNIPFTNILDRGYRSTRVAWRQGQFVMQPTFAKSDEKFNTVGVLRAASVAADRSGNERQVKRSKMSAYVRSNIKT